MNWVAALVAGMLVGVLLLLPLRFFGGYAPGDGLVSERAVMWLHIGRFVAVFGTGAAAGFAVPA